jgi:hypothetical protein
LTTENERNVIESNLKPNGSKNERLE